MTRKFRKAILKCKRVLPTCRRHRRFRIKLTRCCFRCACLIPGLDRLCYGDPVSRFNGLSKQSTENMIPDVLSSKQIDDGVYDARNESADSAPNRSSDDTWGEADYVAGHVAINRRDNWNML